MDTAGKNTKAIAEHIRHQLDEDKVGEQLKMLGRASDNPFTGGKQQLARLADRICTCEGAS